MILKQRLITISPNQIGYLFGFCIFLLCQPYFVWGIWKFPQFVLLVLLLISSFYVRKINKNDFVILPLFLLFILYTAYGSNIFGYIERLLILVLVFIKRDRMIFFLNCFKKIFVISLIFSLLMYIIVIFFAVTIKYDLINPINTLKVSKYFHYPFLVFYSEGFSTFNKYNIRFSGMFEEPGNIGGIATILLFADNYNLKSTQNKILIIAGIFSLSFYFFVSSAVYMLLLLKNKFRLLIALVVFLTFFLTHNEPIIRFLVWDRFIIREGKLKGDNRTSEALNNVYNQFLKGDDVLWGKGVNYTWDKNLMGDSSYKLLILNYGIIIFIVICLAFSLVAICTIKRFKYLIIYLFLVLGMLYQRPWFIYDPAIFFLLIACIYAIQQNTYEKFFSKLTTRTLLSAKKIYN